MSILRLLCLALLLLAIGSIPSTAAEPGESLTDSNPTDPWRESLSDEGAPWYDEQEDSWRRIIVARKDKEEPQEQMQLRGSGGAAMGSILSYLIFTVAIVALAALVWWIAQNMVVPPATISEEVRRVRTKADLSALPFEADAEEAGDPEGALERALARGDWNRAVIWIYACLLFTLDHAGLLRLKKGKTNRSYLQEIDREQDEARKTLEASMQAFELVYFGHLPSDEETATALHQRYKALLRRLEGRA